MRLRNGPEQKFASFRNVKQSPVVLMRTGKLNRQRESLRAKTDRKRNRRQTGITPRGVHAGVSCCRGIRSRSSGGGRQQRIDRMLKLSGHRSGQRLLVDL